MQAVSAHIQTPTRTAPHVTGEIRLPGLPDVRPFGNELTGQGIELDATALSLISADQHFDLLFENERQIAEYLAPVFSATHAAHENVLNALDSLSCVKTPSALAEQMSGLAIEQLNRVKDALLEQIAHLPDAVKTKTGQCPQFSFDNLSLFVRNDPQTDMPTIGIEGAETFSQFVLCGEKVDGTTRRYIARLALHLGIACDVSPVPFTLGAHTWADDYVTLTLEMADAIMFFIKSLEWHSASFLDWWHKCRSLLGKEFDGLVDAINDIYGHGEDDIYVLVQTLIDKEIDTEQIEDNLMEWRHQAGGMLSRIAISHSSIYNSAPVDSGFLRELRKWRDDARCTHTSVVDALITITELSLEYLPDNRAELGSLTDIEFFGNNVVYSVDSPKSCAITTELYEQQHQYLMETGEECAIPVYINDEEWLKNVKGHLTGWWLLHYLETVMEKYNVHSNC